MSVSDNFKLTKAAAWHKKTMTLDEATDWSIMLDSLGYKSDGCTFARDFGFRSVCRMHDKLWEFLPISAARADWLFFKGIMRRGLHYLPIAISYYFAVRFVWLTGIYRG